MLVPIVVVVAALGLVGTAYAQTETANGAPATAPAVARRYVVTLLNSFDPIPDRLLPSDLNGLKVYRTQNVVFGKTIYFVRVGFFATSAEANAAKGRLSERFPGAFVTEITEDEYAGVAGTNTRPTPPAARGAAAAASEPVATVELFAITLLSSAKVDPAPAGPLPKALAKNTLYLGDTVLNGKSLRTLNLGFFTSRAEADRARALLLPAYPQAKVRATSASERDVAAENRIEIPNGSPPTLVRPTRPLAAPAIAAAGTPAIEAQATRLLDLARDALTRSDNATAVQALQELLRLPPNRQSQDAQELIGLAYERLKSTSAAKREYRLYLKLYPAGPGAERVRQRLAALDEPTAAPTLKAARKKDINVTTAYGSFSQYYYRGDSRLDTTTVGPTITTDTLTNVDQSALISSLDLTGRMRSGDWDNRIVVRDNYTINFLENAENFNRLYSAYGEVRNKTYDYGMRIGRQPGNTGGVLGRFDGITASYGFLPKWRLNLVAGEPVEFNPINSDKLLWGANVDFGTFAEHWNGNFYYIYQDIDDITDRQAIGTELRYFDPTLSVMLLTDYDLAYGELNIAMLQGTWQVGTATTVNFLGDHRRAPVLQTSNALINEVDTSIKSQLQTLSENELRAQALARTPLTDLFMVGINHNFNSTWQVGGDVKLYNTSGTPANGTQPEQTGSGNVNVYTAQGIATSLFSRSDISVLSLSYLDSRDSEASSASLSNRSVLRERWTLDLSLRYLNQQFATGVDVERLTPMLRVGYRWGEHMTLEAEAGVENTTTTTATETTDNNLRFWMLGYRWDF